MSAAGPSQGARPPPGGGGAKRRSGRGHSSDTTRHAALASDLGDALRARGWMCATAESCTGGLVAGAITDIAGSSTWFERGFVTYSNEAKAEMLFVPQTTIDDFGAVSEPAARAMAEGALARSRAHVAVAVTGIAGPGGAVPGKPVGTVCFAWSARDGDTRVLTRHLPGDRAAVRHASVTIALEGLVALALNF